MRIERLHMRHFRGIRELELQFHPRLNVLVGVNGSGKSSVLDCLAILLSRLTGRIVSTKGTGRLFTEHDVQMGEKETVCSLDVALMGSHYHWEAGKSTYKGRKPTLTNQAAIGRLVQSIHDALNVDAVSSVPLAVFYSVNRLVDKVPLRVKKTHVFDQYAALAHSLTGKREEADFKLFFEWFRNREDVENDFFRNQARLLPENEPDVGEYPDRQLQAVRQALGYIMPGFSDLRVRRKPRLQMMVTKQERAFPIQQLSDGEKCLLALVGDMARRLAIANPGLEDPLQGEAVFLIDEVDLHLHPAWQRMVLPRLLATFPRCQFIVTTHSPQVLGEVEAECIFILKADAQGEIRCERAPLSKGLDTGELTSLIFEAPVLNTEANEQLNTLFALILDGKEEAARALMAEIEGELGDIPALIKARTMLDLF